MRLIADTDPGYTVVLDLVYIPNKPSKFHHLLFLISLLLWRKPALEERDLSAKGLGGGGGECCDRQVLESRYFEIRYGARRCCDR